MGKTRLLAVIVAILIVVILAVLLLPGREAEPVQKEEKEPMVEIVAARAEIPAYTFITEEMVYLKEVPESSVHINDLKTLEEVIGKRSLVTIVVDEPVMRNHIIDPDAPENRLAYNIEEGMRAMTIAVDDTAGVCSQIRAGDFVDIIASVQFKIEDDKDEKDRDDEDNGEDEKDPYRELDERTLEIVKTVGETVYLMHMQNIEVLSLDQDQLYAPKQEDTGLYYYRYVTLSVPAENCQKLAWAAREGNIYLALRGENDDGLVETDIYGTVKAAVKEGDEFLWR